MVVPPSRCTWSMFAILFSAAILTVFHPLVIGVESATSRRDLAVLHSDDYAETVLTVSSTNVPVGFNAQEHAKISTLLETTKDMMKMATSLVKQERTRMEGRKMMEEANAVFNEVKDHLRRKLPSTEASATEHEANQEKLRRRYSNHNVQEAADDEERGLDVSRRIYETVITFPECLEQLIENCISLVNTQVQDLGLDTYEIVVHEKRTIDQPGYNKVVIVTDMLGERVMGRLGDGIVSYPFIWDDSVLGPRLLSVDGKWNCFGHTPEACCDSIKQSAPHPNTKGDNVECHIFVPYGGVGNPKRQDRIIINLSPDGRVQEAPIIT